MQKIKKIILAGGTGQLGKALVAHFKDKADDIVILSRTSRPALGNVRYLSWDGSTCGLWWPELEGADLLVNLAGYTINCRHNESNRRVILESRVQSIRALAAAVKRCGSAPAIWVQAASGAIYDHSQQRPMSETDNSRGKGFVADVCQAWEGAFEESTEGINNMRKVCLRISLVLGKKEGAFPRLKRLTQWGLGGKAGKGRQRMSWIHEEDVPGIVEWVMKTKNLNGPLNCAAPLPISNQVFMEEMRKACAIPFGLPAPEFAVRIGATLIGTEASLVLDNFWIEPVKLLNSGFRFKYAALDEAISNLMMK